MAVFITTICTLFLSFAWAEELPRPPVKLQFELGPLKLSYLPYRALRQDGLVSLRELLTHTPKTLKLIEGVAAKAIDEITFKLAERDLRYGDSFLGRDVPIIFEGAEENKWTKELQQNLLRQAQIGPLLLTAQTTRLLKSALITTLNRLLQWTSADLVKLAQCKEINLTEILVRLRERGLMFGDQLSGEPIPILVSPPVPVDRPLEFAPDFVDFLAVRNVTTLQALLQMDFERPDWSLQSQYRQQLQVTLFERRLKPGQKIRGPIIPIVARSLSTKPAKPAPPPVRQPAPPRVLKPALEKTPDQLLLGPLLLSYRPYRALHNADIKSLRVLLILTNADLNRVRDMASLSLREIREAVAARSLEFGYDFEGPDVPIDYVFNPKLDKAIRLSADVFELLRERNVRNLNNLSKYSREELFELVQFNESSLREIEWALARWGFRVGESYDGPIIRIVKIKPKRECAEAIVGPEKD